MNHESDTKYHVLLAFDFGMRRIGVAVGQAITKTASPLAVILAQEGVPDWNIIKGYILDWQPDALIVGIPYNMDGSNQMITAKVLEFSEQLKARFSLPVFLSDERLTTIEARREAIATGVKASKAIDDIAAKFILESWFREKS